MTGIKIVERIKDAISDRLLEGLNLTGKTRRDVIYPVYDEEGKAWRASAGGIEGCSYFGRMSEYDRPQFKMKE
jgi:hypothetical protein